MARSIRIELPETRTPLIEMVATIFRRQVADRCGADLTAADGADLCVIFDVQAGVGREGFRIKTADQTTIRITGNDHRGLLYGVGRVLRSLPARTRRSPRSLS